jgi:hypothetical protein
VLQKCDFKIIDENKDFAEGRGEETEEYIFLLRWRNPIIQMPNQTPERTSTAVTPDAAASDARSTTVAQL